MTEPSKPLVRWAVRLGNRHAPCTPPTDVEIEAIDRDHAEREALTFNGWAYVRTARPIDLMN